MLRRIMDSNGIETKQVPSDADLLIATTAVQSSITIPTINLGEDTDLLILLLYYYECGSMQLIFRPNHDKKTMKSKIWDIGKTTCVLGQETCNLVTTLFANFLYLRTLRLSEGTPPYKFVIILSPDFIISSI
jgi:hypothetical protein